MDADSWRLTKGNGISSIAMDGKHCLIQSPANFECDFFNYKSFFSIVIYMTTILYMLMWTTKVEFQMAIFYKIQLFSKIWIMVQQFLRCSYYPKKAEKSTVCHWWHVSSISTIISWNHILDSSLWDQVTVFSTTGFQDHVGSWKMHSEYFLLFWVLRKPILLQPKKAQSIIMAYICLHIMLWKSSVPDKFMLVGEHLNIKRMDT